MSKEGATTSKEPIHSGHFMISNPHEVKVDEDEDFEVDVVDVDDSMTDTGIAIDQKIARPDKDEKPVTFYKFGPEKTQSIAIDVSLNKLKKCINVAYMKLTTPKWKDFKGLKLQWKHRIRLNNVIWRAYYMEFRKPDKKKKYCYFAVPDDDTTHTKIEGTVLEGMYWKRRMEAVCAQYKKWRTFNRPAKKKNSTCCRKRENSCSCTTKVISRPNQSRTPQNLSTYDDIFDVDEFDNEFTNSLFESLNVPFIFPNPKEFDNDQMANADIMQPCLLSLQPSIEEIMAGDLNGMDMQQQQMMQPQIMNGGHQLQSDYRQKPYENSNTIIHYNSQQPTRQSSAIPSNGLMSTQHSQPLYSRAIYDSLTPVNNSPQPFAGEENTGRASSTISFGAPTPQPYMPQVIPAVSGGNIIQHPIPSPALVNNQIRTAASPFQTQDVFRNRFIESNNQQLPHQQQQQQFWINTVQQQQQQHYNNLEHSRRTIQMLQSPNPNSPMNMGNGISFGSPNALINLTTTPSLSNFIQNQQSIISNHPNQIMQGAASPVFRYLTTNTLNQQPQQPTVLPGLLSKPNGLNYNQDQNIFVQVKMEAKPFHHHIVPDSPATGDIYRSIPNTVATGLSTPNQDSGIFSAPERPVLFRNDPIEQQNGESSSAPVYPSTARFQRKRAHHSVSNRASPSYTQAASTSSSDAMLSDSESAIDEKTIEPRQKKRANSLRVKLDVDILPEERKRILHLNAEKNRRNALKDGFETLTSVIPAIEEAGVKPTNAVVLNRAANFIRSLKSESDQRKKDLENCREKIEKMNARIAMLQSNLPSSCRSQGSSGSNANIQTQIEQSYEKHVKDRSRQDYRYWLMGQMMKPLILNYAKSVHPDSDATDKVIDSTQLWLSKQWNVGELRPLASKMLVFLATELNVLKNSAALPEHVAKEINKTA